MNNFKKYTVYQLKEVLKDYKRNNPTLKTPAISKMKKFETIKFFIDNKIPIPPLDELPPKKTNVYNPLKKYNTKPYNQQEQEKFVEEEMKEDLDPLNAKKAYFNVKMNKYETIKVQPHQEKFIKKFIYSNTRGAITFHGVGTGKTLTAVISSYYYLKMYPKNKVIVISPSALLYNFVEGMVQYGLNIQDNRYKFFTYEKYLRKPETGRNALVIIDEAHNFRTAISAEEKQDPETGENTLVVKSNRRAYFTKKWATDVCHKIILLTATPFVNFLYDIENLMSMIDARPPEDRENFYEICTARELRQDHFQWRISHYESKDRKDFPERKEKIVPIYMRGQLLQNYKDIEKSGKDREGYAEEFFEGKETKDLKSFFNGVRRASNSLEYENNPKIQYIMDTIKEDETSKNVIYSSFMEAGVDLLMKKLKEEGIKYQMITGRQSVSQKEDAKKYFNGYDFKGKYSKPSTSQVNESDMQNKYINSEYRVLIITKAGAEGVDLVATTNIFLLDNVWNDALSEQIIARAIRFRSHNGLPENKRFVNVHRMLLVKPSDEIVINKIRSRNIDYNKILNAYQNPSLEQNKMIAPEKPAIDLYLYVLSKAKQETIDEFVKELDNYVEGFEDYMSKTEEKIMKEIIEIQQEEERVLTERERTSIVRKYLDEQAVSAIEKIKDTETELLQRKVMREAIKGSKKKKTKNDRVKQLQQYFTPKKEVKKMIDFSSIKSTYKQLDVLEPSAGWGNIIKELLELKKDMFIDMVEIDPSNRVELEKLQQLAPDLLNLKQTQDFLEYLPSKRYDYIFMNPPFHLRKSEIAKYKKDYYDIDFVKRAFGMLKVDGELVAIVSTKWLNNKDFKDWLNEHDVEHFEETVKWKGEVGEMKEDLNSLNISFIKLKKENNYEDNDLLKIDSFNDRMRENARLLENNLASIDEINN